MARDPLDKVRKLLALSRSANVHEAAVAAATAQALIERYRLESLLAAEAAVAADPVDEEVLEAARRLRRWKTVLAAALAEVNDCLVYRRPPGREHQIVIAGRASDRAAVRSLWEWLVPQLEWLSATHGAGREKRWHDDFRVGAVDTVTDRLRGVAGEEQGRIESTALVRLEPALQARRAAVDSWAEQHLAVRAGRRVLVGASAWNAGRRAAESVKLGDGQS